MDENASEVSSLCGSTRSRRTLKTEFAAPPSSTKYARFNYLIWSFFFFKCSFPSEHLHENHASPSLIVKRWRIQPIFRPHFLKKLIASWRVVLWDNQASEDSTMRNAQTFSCRRLKRLHVVNIETKNFLGLIQFVLKEEADGLEFPKRMATRSRKP